MSKSMIAAYLAFSGALLWAASRPNFTGTWKLDPLRSRIDGKSERKNLVFKFDHNDPALRVVIYDANSKNDGNVLELTTDGTEHQGVLDGHPVTASASWDQSGGDRLVLTIKQSAAGGEHTITREFRLGDKGRILTTVMSVRDGSGQKQAYEFFVKQ